MSRLTILRRIHSHLPLARSMSPGHLLALRQQILDRLLALPYLLLLLLERLLVEELAALAGLSAELERRRVMRMARGTGEVRRAREVSARVCAWSSELYAPFWLVRRALQRV